MNRTLLIGLTFALVFGTTKLYAHCDTLAGPVVTDAREALAHNDVTPVLKWVKPEQEATIREAFRKTMAVRKKGGMQREVADTWFFETLVRIHRQGEGESFEGLKPGDENAPGIEAADRAIESGSPAEAEALLTAEMREGLHERFERAAEAKKHANESVEAGRKYVEAYVDFIHYLEKLYDDASGATAPGTSAHGH